jgi:hypothetical protein
MLPLSVPVHRRKLAALRLREVPGARVPGGTPGKRAVVQRVRRSNERPLLVRPLPEIDAQGDLRRNQVDQNGPSLQRLRLHARRGLRRREDLLDHLVRGSASRALLGNQGVPVGRDLFRIVHLPVRHPVRGSGPDWRLRPEWERLLRHRRGLLRISLRPGHVQGAAERRDLLGRSGLPEQRVRRRGHLRMRARLPDPGFPG